MEKLDYVGNEQETRLEAELKYKEDDPDKMEAHMLGSVWKVTIPAGQLDGFSELEGGVRLVVHAEDRNNHRTTVNGQIAGAKLDSTPNTPARVYAENNNGDIIFYWHNETSLNLSAFEEYVPSRDAKGGTLPAGAFAYDFEEGDSSHILWFSGDVGVDPDLTKSDQDGSGGSTDIISITTLPERDESLPR